MKTFNRQAIFNKIKSRLGTQDRISGDKIWLSMRIIKRILGDYWFGNWSRDVLERTKVYKGNTADDVIMLDTVDKIELRDCVTEPGKCNVFATVGSTEYQVFTSDSKYTPSFKEMLVSDISKIALDHTKPIDEILKTFGAAKLPELDKISELAKRISADIDDCNGDKLNNQLIVMGNKIQYKADPNQTVYVDVDELYAEMETIKNYTDYSLMDSSINSSLGNGTNNKTTSSATKKVTKPRIGCSGIGQYAKNAITNLLIQGKLTPSQIDDLKDPDYCRQTLGVGNFPVLVDTSVATPAKGRYYSKDARISPYVICNNWFDNKRSKLEVWLDSIK